MYSQEYIAKIAKLTIAELEKKALEDKVRTFIANSADKSMSKKIIEKLKKFFKFPTKSEAIKIVEKSTDKDIQDAYKIIPKFLKEDNNSKESFSFKDLKKKALLLAAISVLGGGMLTGCGKYEAPPKSEIMRYYEMNLKASNFTPTYVTFKYDHKYEEGFTIHYAFKLGTKYLTYTSDPTFTISSDMKEEIHEDDYKDIALEARQDIANEMIAVEDILKEENNEAVKTFVNQSGVNFEMTGMGIRYRSPVSNKEHILVIKNSTITMPSSMMNSESVTVGWALNYGTQVGEDTVGDKDNGILTRTGLTDYIRGY